MTAITVNGQPHRTNATLDTPLLYVLRDELQLDGPKFGCGLNQCGACSVLIEGRSQRSCVLPIAAVRDPVTTAEGLGTPERPHAVQRAFIAEQAAQCGYCTAGLVVSSVALLQKHPQPTDAQIRTALDGNLCRCGSHLRVMRAVHRAAGERA